MNCWPTAWIAAAKAAGLAHGMDASTGQFFVRGGDTMRQALEMFAHGILEAERQDHISDQEDAARWRHAVAFGFPIRGPQTLAWRSDGTLVLANAPVSAIDLARDP